MLKKFEIKHHLLSEDTSIRDTIRTMDQLNSNFLIIVNSKKKISGVFTSGDFRNAVFKGIDIREPVSLVLNKDYIHVDENCARSKIVNLFKTNSFINLIPVVKNKKIIKILKRKDFLKSIFQQNEKKFKKLQAVIMAGGKGSRMEPFTKILPKPLIPYDGIPMIEHVMNNFKENGISKFYISINEKKQMIKGYFENNKKYKKLNYIEEKKFLGTAGSLKLLEEIIFETFFVCNCDNIIKSNLNEFYEFHKKENYNLSIVASLQSFPIPYGVCNISKNGELIDIAEKPKFNYPISTGLYLIEPRVLKFIPNNTFFNMTDLIKKIIKQGMKVGIYPVSEKSWVDLSVFKSES